MLKKNITKHLSLVLSVLMLLTILPLGVFAEGHNTDNTVRSFDCDYCGRGQIVNRSKRDVYTTDYNSCGHSSQCEIETVEVVITSWTECTTPRCYHSGPSVREYTEYIHTRCGR